ncbi:hypothetical protein HA402_000572 [Bradysia odoriphaga]|nr:hypothetical protein HA402_000572 [Bradysia odoriphaga]
MLLVSGGQTTTNSAQSPIGANAPSLSPGGSATGAPTGALSPGAMSQASNNAPATSSCCENGRPIMTDPVSGQTVCSCQYDSARLALSGYSRIPTAGVYGSAYPSTDQNPYPSIGVDSSAFYSPLSNPYALKESGPTSDMSAWTSAGLQPTAGYYPYDPALAAYGYGAGYDLAARRKNATRESTATLKAWLNEHKKNPYPTKGEKIMLAIITKMTLTQVSTWFANARRRLKKENKMTWEPKNKTDDDDDAMISDDEKDKDEMEDRSRDHKDSLHHVKAEHCKDEDDDDLTDDDRKPDSILGHTIPHPNIPHHPPYHHHAMLGAYPGIKEELSGSKNPPSSDCGVPIPATKPKIWSLADTAACKTPPPLQAHHLHQQHGTTPSAAWMTGGYHPHNPHSTNADMMMAASGAHTGMNMSGVGMNTLNHTQQNMGMTSGMMDNFANSQYSRYGGFLGASHHYNTNSNNNNNHITNMPVTGQHKPHPNTPITPTHLQQQNSNGSSTNGSTHSPQQQQQHQQQQQQQQQHLQHQQQSMGFPEVQTDTPPQTPPNLKLPSVASTLLTQTPTTGTCYNTNNQQNNSINNNNTSTTNNNLNQSSNGYSSSSPPGSNNYVGNFTRMQQHSPQKAQEYSQHMMASPQQDTAAFKPFYKR